MLILCYHELADDEATPWRLRPAAFADHLRILADRGYKAARLPIAAGQGQPHHFALTFDDGTLGCVRYAQELLLQRELTAYFYICPGFIDGTVRPGHPTNYMTWAQIRELSARHPIGAHSMTHPPRFLELSVDNRRQEMSVSKEIVEQEIGRRCPDWATPHGYVDDDLERQARDIGFSTLVTTKFGPNRVINPFRLERWEVRSPCPPDTFIATLTQWEALR